MFNITGGELVIILILALIVLGPDKLPDFVRRAGRVYAELKKMSSGFREEFREVMDEPVREMRETADLARSWFEEGKSTVDSLGVAAIDAVSLPGDRVDEPRADDPEHRTTQSAEVAPAVDAFGAVLPMAGEQDRELPGAEPTTASTEPADAEDQK